MAEKEIVAKVNLQIPARKATPAPPIGSALGPHGVNIADFTKQFNERTKDVEEGLIIPVEISIYNDRSLTFITKSPPAAVLIKKALKLEKASGEPNKTKVGKITKAQLEQIAKQKEADLNAANLENAIKIIAGTARSMGVEVEN